MDFQSALMAQDSFYQSSKGGFERLSDYALKLIKDLKNYISSKWSKKHIFLYNSLFDKRKILMTKYNFYSFLGSKRPL